MDTKLDFEKIDIQVDVSFWMKYNQLKLDKFKLSMDPVDIFGTYQLPMTQELNRNIVVDDYSLKGVDKKSTGGLLETKIHGVLLNTNTVEEYKLIDIDLKADSLLKEKFQKNLQEDSWLTDPSLLNSFLLVSFADLKKYVYQYNFKPYIIDDSSFNVSVTKSKLLHKVYKTDIESLNKLKSAYLSYLTAHEAEHGYNQSVLVVNSDTFELSSIGDLIESPSNNIVFYIDPSPHQPSCMIKNLLFALSTRFTADVTKVRLISLRDKISKMGTDFEFKHS